MFITGSYPLIDSYIFGASLIVAVLSAWRYIEAVYLNTVSTALLLLMWILLWVGNADNITYVVISAYNLIMAIESMIVWTKNYKLQQAHNEKETTNG